MTISLNTPFPHFQPLGSNETVAWPEAAGERNDNPILIFDPRPPPPEIPDSCRIIWTPDEYKLYTSRFGSLSDVTIDYDALPPVRLSTGFSPTTNYYAPFPPGSARYMATVACGSPLPLVGRFNVSDCSIYQGKDLGSGAATSIFADTTGDTDFAGNPYVEWKYVEQWQGWLYSSFAGGGASRHHGVEIDLVHSTTVQRRRNIDASFQPAHTTITLQVNVSGLQSETLALWGSTENYTSTISGLALAATVTSRHTGGFSIDQLSATSAVTSHPTSVSVNRKSP